MPEQAPSVPPDLTRNDRKVWVKKKNGDLEGWRFNIPKGDFARFLGYKPPTADEKSGKKQVSANRVLEVALQKSFNKLGPQALQRGSAYTNMYIAYGAHSNKPGRAKDAIRDGLDSIKASVELNKASNVFYLEMQYKFQLANKNFGTISNLMKVRHESTKKAINEVR